MLQSIQDKTITNPLFSWQLLRLQGLSGPWGGRGEAPLLALGSPHYPTKHRAGCSQSGCTPCWQADGDPNRQGDFWLHLLEAPALGEKEKMPAAPQRKGPLYLQCPRLLPFAEHFSSMLTLGWQGRGNTRRARGPVIAVPCHHLCHFLMLHEKQTAADFVNFSWRTHVCSKRAIQVFSTALYSE